MWQMEPTYRHMPAGDPRDAVEAVILDVDGEVFELRPDEYGGTRYSWLTGPNGGYGFATSPTPGSKRYHRSSWIRCLQWASTSSSSR